MADIEESKVQRRQRKGVVTRHVNSIARYIAEEETADVKSTIEKVKEAFKNFTSAHTRYHNFLTDEKDIEDSDNYFYEVQNDYIKCLKTAKAWLKEAQGIPADVKNAEVFNRNSTIELLSLPKVELVKYDGDPLTYHSFMATFDEAVDNLNVSNKTKLTRLLQYTTGRAYEAIRSCVLVEGDRGYIQARKLLLDRFGNEHLVTERIIQGLLNGKPVKSSEDMLRLSDELANSQITLSQMRRLHEVECQASIVKIAERLQGPVKGRWRRKALEIKAENDRYPLFEEFAKFVKKEALEASDPVYGLVSKERTAVSGSAESAKPKKSDSFASVAGPSRRVQSCLLCQNDHRLLYCSKFKAMKPSERLQLVKSRKLCENCLLANHVVADCRKNTVCTVPGCGAKHTKFIHIDPDPRNVSREQEHNVRLVNASLSTDSDVCLPTVGVRVNGEYETCALLDTGSSQSFCSKSFVERLGLQGSPINYSRVTLNGSKTISSELVSFTLTSLDGSESLKLDRVIVVDQIPLVTSCPDVKLYPHLRGLQLVASDQTVCLLLGQDNSEALVPLEIRKGRQGDPFACRTLFGWAVNGPNRLSSPIGRSVISHFISSAGNEIERICSFEGDDLDDQAKGLSFNDVRVLELWRKEVCLREGHYQLPIPWKDNVSFPDNMIVAKSRLKALKSSLIGKGLYERYDEEVQKLIQCDYAEPVPSRENECVSDKIWYLPHRPVISDKKPDKVRIVFDCASRYHGESLNDKVFQGPDLANKLLNVLLRFREHEFCVMADVEAMYYQVRIPIKDRDALRFLWFDLDGRILQYRMTCHVFGGTWCSSSSTFALRQTLVDNPDVSHAISRTVLQDFYVDDCLKSFQTFEEAVDVMKGTRDLLKSGGFKLTKFVANDVRILSEFPVEERAKETREFCSDFRSKVLGIHWNVPKDQFFFTVNLSPDERVCRRTMLSTVASLYDPLGFLGPLILVGKILFQHATKLKLGWDEEVPRELKDKWLDWLVNLRGASSIEIPRCIKPTPFNDAAIELHHFSDSSEKAYGCCTYVRCVNRNGDIHTSLLLSKNKVAPMKAITIPRLELQAAVLAVRVNDLLCKQLSIDLLSSVFWVDSELVLKYISNDDRRFHVFVANRVSVIRELSHPEQWRHIAGSRNPADVITRGTTVEGLNRIKWFEGPQFLRQHKSEWNITVVDRAIPESDPEVKKNVPVLACCPEEVSATDRLLAYFSDWFRLLKAVSWLLKFKEMLKNGYGHVAKSVSAFDLKQAENCVLQYIQMQFYSHEIECLNEGRSIPKSSPIKSLSPFVGKGGLLRVGGRLKYAKVSDDNKNPVLISGKHRVASLIVKSFHNVAHTGTEWVVSMIRRKFWITRVRPLVKSIARSCLACQKMTAPPGVQYMADLPPERIIPHEPPFANVGVDCFGPFIVKQGRSEVKRYGCLFTCMASRAIHLERLSSMDTDSFLNAFRRFISRRGCPKKVWSDNGSNLIGGKAELEKGYDQIENYCLKNRIQWSLIPPQAPHMGGLWERMVRTVKKVLLGILDGKVVGRLSDDMLETLLCESEFIVNSRPLTKVSDDVNDFQALTPNHLLIPKGQVVYSPGEFCQADIYKRKWKCVQYLIDLFWKRWTSEYVPGLQKRSKWHNVQRNLKIGDLVLIADENTPRGIWPMAIVIEVYPSRDNLIRSVKVKTKSSVFVRPISKLVLLECQ